MAQLFAVEWSSWKWGQLWEVENFHWQLGVTPFSNLQVPLFASAVYLVSLFGLQVILVDFFFELSHVRADYFLSASDG
jgi:hypothetical protein